MSKLLWVLYFLCLTGGLLQNFAQFLHKVADHDGLGQKAIHAAFQGIAAVLVECVGSHGKDRDLCQCRVAQCADLAGDLDAVHVRQTPVDDIGVVDIAHLDGLARTQHRNEVVNDFLAVYGIVDDHPRGAGGVTVSGAPPAPFRRGQLGSGKPLRRFHAGVVVGIIGGKAADRRTWRAENCGGSLRYCTPRMASVVILYCSVTRANHSPEPSSVPARSTSVSS